MAAAHSLAALREERKRARVISGAARKSGPKPKLGDAEIHALVDEWRAGTAVDEIARRFNVADTTIYRALKRAARERHPAIIQPEPIGPEHQ